MELQVKHGARGGKKANHSQLMQAMGTAGEGEIVNACPFGCETEDLDDKGHCPHYVGVTLTDDKTRFEPFSEPDQWGHRRLLGGDVQKVRPTDKLLRITTSYRVYRPAAKPEKGE